MKSKLFLLVALPLLGFSSTAVSQTVALTAFSGYTFQDRVFGFNGEVIIRDGAAFGGILGFRPVATDISIDLAYSFQQTSFDVIDYRLAVTNRRSIPGNVHYITAGASYSRDFDARVSPYAGFMVGAGVMAPAEEYSDLVRFAVGGRLGAIIGITERFGLMLQTQLMVPVQGFGIAVGCSGGGCGSGGSVTSTATQFGFTGGIEVKLKN
jgi:hypothetical protein